MATFRQVHHSGVAPVQEIEPMTIVNRPPLILAARVVSPMVVEIDCTTRETLRVDLSTVVRESKAFATIRLKSVFEKLVVDEWGHALEWPGGLDIGADRLYDLAREHAGLPTVAAFSDWMSRNGFSLSTAAEALGMTRRMVAHYRTGRRPIPLTVWLACRGWEVVSRERRKLSRKAA